MLPASISGRFPPNGLVHDAVFQALAPARTLAAAPLGFVDAGARGGVHDIVLPIAQHTAVLGFEADRQACEELNRRMANASPWAALKFMPIALSDRRGAATLHLCAAPTNHSLLPVNKAFAARYRMEKFAQTGALPLSTETLDEVLFGHLAHEPHWGEFMKLDTQGTEYEVLRGASRTLKERTVALFVEVEFCPIYEGQKLFSELELMLRGYGLVFYGFHSTHERSCKLLDKRRFLGRERLLHADAVFFKDPLLRAADVQPPSPRGEQVLFVCALLLGYFDFALELAKATFARDAASERSVTKLIETLSYIDPSEARKAARGLLDRIDARPDLANIAIGRFVDERRAASNFGDVPVNLD